MNKKKYYLIYQITNNVNRKIYIGKHETFNIDDNYFGSGKLIQAAIKKYGLDKFVKIILFELQNRDEMNLLEKMVVTPEFCARDDTYNINIGGDGGWSYINEKSDYKLQSSKRRVVTSKAGKIANEKMRQKQLSSTKLHLDKLSDADKIAYKDNMSNKLKNWHAHHQGYFAGQNNPMFGKFHTIEARKKMSEFHKLHNSMHGKIWICNDKTHESKTHLSSLPIPEGWRKGRFCK